MAPDELAAWLRLTETPGVGIQSARRLLAALGSAEAVDAATPAAVQQVCGEAVASAWHAPNVDLADLLQRTSRWLAEAASESPRSIVTLGDANYPQWLLQTADPPLLLYVLGRVELLNAMSLAVVGSRNPTAQGIDHARAFSARLSEAGLTIVSGLALGIDGAAHEGALQGAGSTVAVVGTGLDRIYPKRHQALAHRIAREGAIVSEFSLGTPALSSNFPRRNRIIAGMSRGTLVVEAALKSGSLITARLASEAGRDVFAIPGSINAMQSKGCHALIRQGAKLVEQAEDILEEIVPDRAVASVGGPSEVPHESGTDPLLEALGHDPVSLDALEARTGWSTQTLNIKLLELELDGHVARLPGQLFQRRRAT